MQITQQGLGLLDSCSGLGILHEEKTFCDAGWDDFVRRASREENIELNAVVIVVVAVVVAAVVLRVTECSVVGITDKRVHANVLATLLIGLQKEPSRVLVT
jgi:hypothetical protein